MTMCNVKGAHSDESTPNSAVSLSSTEHFKVFQLIVLAHNCRQLFLAKKKPKTTKKEQIKALINPLYTTCPTPNSSQTKLASSW